MNLSLTLVNEVLVVSWEEPIEPNDFTWNYTITISHVSGSEIYSTTLRMNETQLNVSNEKLGMYVCVIVSKILS